MEKFSEGKKTIETLQERASYFDKYRSYKYLFTKTPVDIDPDQGVDHVSLREYFN